ncbi:MAG: AMP-binding protein [Candidatus Methanomethylicus sp.]|nr:AMP-binding protein [Candidatus Methanomethylicus sp.]
MNYIEKPWLKFYPNNIPHDVTVPSIPLFKLIDNSIVKYGNKTAMIYMGTNISYTELGQYIEKAASAFNSIGIKKGSVVAIYLPNCPQFPICYYAILKLGAIPTAVSFLFTPREVRQQLSNSRAECIVMLDLMYPKTKPLLDELKINNVVLANMTYFLSSVKRTLGNMMGKIPKANIPADAPVHYFEEFMKRNSTDYPKPEINPNADPATILYTSGTTGLPKGITLSHYNIVASMHQVMAYAGDLFESEYTNYLLAFLPFFHVYGQATIMTGGFSLGKTLIVLPNPKIEELMKLIDKYKIGLFFGIPASYSIMLKNIKSGKHKLTSLKLCPCGSDKIPKNIADEFMQLTGAKLVEGYGLTEASSGVTGPPVGGEVREGTIGIPMPSTMVAIADPDRDEFMPFGEPGEMVVNGPQVMMKVWNDEEKTAKYFSYIGGFKWLRTGDAAYMDNDGYLHFVERIKDIIKYKSYQVYPKEIEQVISSHPSVYEVAVIGVDTPEKYQIVKAYVVLKEGYKPTCQDDILHWCSDNLAEYKVPRAIEFVNELPKNKIGKVLKKELKEKENMATAQVQAQAKT